MSGYWNHNTAFHTWIMRITARRGHRDLAGSPTASPAYGIRL